MRNPLFHDIASSTRDSRNRDFHVFTYARSHSTFWMPRADDLRFRVAPRRQSARLSNDSRSTHFSLWCLDSTARMVSGSRVKVTVTAAFRRRFVSVAIDHDGYHFYAGKSNYTCLCMCWCVLNANTNLTRVLRVLHVAQVYNERLKTETSIVKIIYTHKETTAS